MRILWFVSKVFPAVASRLGHKTQVSIWWVVELARQLTNKSSVNLSIVSCDHHYKHLEQFAEEGINYHVVPARRSELAGWRNGKLVKKLAELANDSDADIIDIHGTEYLYGLITPYVKQPVLITIQGLMNAVVRKAFGHKSLATVLSCQTRSIHDFKWNAVLLYNYLGALRRSWSEREVFRRNLYFAGRTQWDRSMAYKLSPNVRRYFTCPRILRVPFYKTLWSGPKDKGYRIFACSRFDYYKGFDDMIYMFASVANRLPSCQLRVAGDCHRHGWGGYIRGLAHKLNVADKVKFLGVLSAGQIAEELRHATVYVHPTYIDNSPNSLAEAMCVGVPCVASKVGGITSMVRDRFNGLLFEAGNIGQFSEKVCRVITDAKLAESLGRNAHQTAITRHDPGKITATILDIYRAVLDDNRNRRKSCRSKSTPSG